MFTANYNSLAYANGQSKIRPQHTPMPWHVGNDATPNSFVTQHMPFPASSFSRSNVQYPTKLNHLSSQISKLFYFEDFESKSYSKNEFDNLSSKVESHKKGINPVNFKHSHKRQILEIEQSTTPKSFHIRDILKRDNQNHSLCEETHAQNTKISSIRNKELISAGKKPTNENNKTTILNVAKSNKEIPSSSKSFDARSYFPTPSNVKINDNDSPPSAFTVPSTSGTKENIHFNNLLPNPELRLKYFFNGCQKMNFIQEPRINNNNNNNRDVRNTSNILQATYSSIYRVQNKTLSIFGSYADEHPILTTTSFSQSSSTASLSAPTTPSSSSTDPSCFSSFSHLYHTNHDRKKFQCPQCRYLTDRKNNLMRHIITMHQDSGKVLECCGMAFQSKSALREHNAVFHSGGYRCQICSRNFCRKALLRRHLTVHSGQKDFYCNLCGYATSHKSNLERHQKVHNKRFSVGRLDFYHRNNNNNNNNIHTKNNNGRNNATIYSNKIPHEIVDDKHSPGGRKHLRSNTDKSPHKNDQYNNGNHSDYNENILNISTSSDDDSEFDVIDVEMPLEENLFLPIKVVDSTNKFTISSDHNINSEEKVNDEKNLSSHSPQKPTQSPKRASKRRGFFTSRIRSTHNHKPTVECDQINLSRQNRTDDCLQETNPEKHKSSTEFDNNGNAVTYPNNNEQLDYSKCVELSKNIQKATDNLAVANGKEGTIINSSVLCDIDSNHKQRNTSCNLGDSKGPTLDHANHKEKEAGFSFEKIICDINHHEDQTENNSCTSSVNATNEIGVCIDKSNYSPEIQDEKTSCKLVNTNCDYRDKFEHNSQEVQGENIVSYKSVNTDCEYDACKEIRSDYSLKENDDIIDTYVDSNVEKSSPKPQISTDRNGIKLGCKKSKRSLINDLYRLPSKTSRLCRFKLYSCPWCRREFHNQLDNDSHVCNQRENTQRSLGYDVPISVLACRKDGLHSTDFQQ